MCAEGITSYCPNCWKEVGERDEICAVCGGRLITHNSLSYEDKLLLALHHPLRQKRAVAVRILGRLRSEKALALFEKQLIESDDVFDLCEAMTALTNYDRDVKVPWFRTMIAHPSPVVSRLGRRLLIEEESAQRNSSGPSAQPSKGSQMTRTARWE